jgi:hypothetical protein
MNMTCDNNIISPKLESSISIDSQTLIELTTGDFTTSSNLFELLFTSFSTSLALCSVQGYNLSLSETQLETYTELSNPEVTEDGFVIIIDTSLAKVYSFSIYSFNQYGNSVLSEMLTIRVSDAIINEVDAIINEVDAIINEVDGMNWDPVWEPVFTSDLSDHEIQLYSTI